MSKQVFDAINDCAAQIRSLGPANEALGRLDTAAATLLRDTGVTRILQPEEYGGFATHPGDFVEAVMQIAALDGAAGWVAGRIGAVPWLLAMAPRRARDEVWEADADSWVAPALAPTGVLQAALDGYLLSGRWPAVPAIDHCDWALLGARVSDGSQPARQRLVHVLVPRSELHIVDAPGGPGLIGTGSRDVIVDYSAVPGYRVLDHDGIVSGAAARRAGLKNPTYRIPFGTVIPLGADAAVVGMARGALADQPAAPDLAADIGAAQAELLGIASHFFNMVLDRRHIDSPTRARGRRGRRHAVRQAVHALDQLLARAGGTAQRHSHRLQRFSRDAHLALARIADADGNALRLAMPADTDARRTPLLSVV